MIRVVIAAVLATAILGASLPAVADARADRTATDLDASVERLEAAGAELAFGSDPAADPTVAPARTVTFSLPAPTWTRASVAYVAIGGPPDGTGDRPVVAYAVGDSATTRRLSLPVPLSTPGGPVVLRGTGDRRVELRLRLTPDGPALVVARPGGESPFGRDSARERVGRDSPPAPRPGPGEVYIR